MYESIDDTDPAEAGHNIDRPRHRLLVGLSVVAGLSILAGVAMFSAQNGKDTPDDADMVNAEKAAYQTALTEALPALRRARLTDFKNVYPDSERIGAVKAQLDVLNRAEASDWAELTHVVFSTETSKVQKLAAIDIYEAVWTGAMLGGRGEQLTKIRGIVENEPDDFPDRDLPTEADEESLGDIMVGGDRALRDVNDELTRHSSTQPLPETGDIVIPPKLFRNIKPRYPSRALNRGIEATIVLRLYVDERGRVDETELVRSQAGRYEDDFIRAAERAARRTRYYPKTINGEPVFDDDGILKRYRFQIDR